MDTEQIFNQLLDIIGTLSRRQTAINDKNGIAEDIWMSGDRFVTECNTFVQAPRYPAPSYDGATLLSHNLYTPL